MLCHVGTMLEPGKKEQWNTASWPQKANNLGRESDKQILNS